MICNTYSKEPSPFQNVTDKKQIGNVEHLNYFGSMITKDARYTHEIKSRIAGKDSTKQEGDSFHLKIEHNFKKQTTKVLHM